MNKKVVMDLPAKSPCLAKKRVLLKHKFYSSLNLSKLAKLLPRSRSLWIAKLVMCQMLHLKWLRDQTYLSKGSPLIARTLDAWVPRSVSTTSNCTCTRKQPSSIRVESSPMPFSLTFSPSFKNRNPSETIDVWWTKTAASSQHTQQWQRKVQVARAGVLPSESPSSVGWMNP